MASRYTRLSPEIQKTILELAETDVSMREIGRALGVARNTVANVISRGTVLMPKLSDDVTKEGGLVAERKCDGCGRMIKVPECIVCRDRKALNIKLD